MNKLTFNKIIIYVISVCVLFIIPIYTIITNTDTLKDGTEFYFKIQVYDPYDMFRGNYLNIAFEEDTVLTDSNYLKLDYDEPCFVTIDVNQNGYAYFKEISKNKPKNTTAYFETTASYMNWQKGYVIKTPTKYYMNENKSLEAEKYLNNNINNAHVKVRVKNGKMVIVGVYVNNVLIDTID